MPTTSTLLLSKWNQVVIITMMVHHPLFLPTPSPSGHTVVQHEERREATKVSLQGKVIFAVEKTQKKSRCFNGIWTAWPPRYRCANNWAMKPRRKQVSASSIFTRYIKKVSFLKLGAIILRETIECRLSSGILFIMSTLSLDSNHQFLWFRLHRLFIDPKQFGIHTFVFYHMNFLVLLIPSLY